MIIVIFRKNKVLEIQEYKRSTWKRILEKNIGIFNFLNLDNLEEVIVLLIYIFLVQCLKKKNYNKHLGNSKKKIIEISAFVSVLTVNYCCKIQTLVRIKSKDRIFLKTTIYLHKCALKKYLYKHYNIHLYEKKSSNVQTFL